eukprot:9460024-Lingulodinium_polyedra.AAC.1
MAQWYTTPVGSPASAAALTYKATMAGEAAGHSASSGGFKPHFSLARTCLPLREGTPGQGSTRFLAAAAA